MHLHEGVLHRDAKTRLLRGAAQVIENDTRALSALGGLDHRVHQIRPGHLAGRRSHVAWAIAPGDRILVKAARRLNIARD